MQAEELPGPSSALVNSKGSLPMPGDPVEEGEALQARPALPEAVRSDSNYSISSTLNDAGHDAVTSPPKAVAAVLPSAARRPLPIPPSKSLSDPPLIPSLRRPEVLQLSQDPHLPERPISPFSPRVASSSETQKPPAQLSRLSREPDEIDLDLINFDSDNETGEYAIDEQGGVIYAGLSDSEGSSGGEEEDFDSHTLYSNLTKSSSPYVRRAWEGSKIVLLPPKYAMPAAYTGSQKQWNSETSMADPKDWERFTAIHALRQQTGSPDTYVGYGTMADGRRLQARLDAERGEVEVTMRAEESDIDGMDRREVLRSFASLDQSLRRTDTVDSSASSGGHALPPHLFISSSPTSSANSSNFPLTPPVSPPLRPAGLPLRSASDSFRTSTSTSDSVLFPSVESAVMSMSKTPLSPTRRLQIVGDTPVYRRKKAIAVGQATSAPSALPSPPRPEAASQQAVEPNGQNPNRLSILNTTSSNSLLNNARGVKKKDSKVRLRVPKWLGGRKDSGSFAASTSSRPASTESAPTTPLESQSLQQLVVPEETQLVIEKVRIIRVDGYVVEWPGQEPILSPPLQQSMQRRSTQALQQYKFRQSALPASSSASSVLPSRQSSNASRVSRKSSSAMRYRHSNASGAALILRDFSRYDRPA